MKDVSVYLLFQLAVALFGALVGALFQARRDRKQSSLEFVRSNRARIYKNLQGELERWSEAGKREWITLPSSNLKPLVEELYLYAPPDNIRFALDRCLLAIERLPIPAQSEYFEHLKFRSLTKSCNEILSLMSKDMADLIKRPGVVSRLKKRQELRRYSYNPIPWARSWLKQQPLLSFLFILWILSLAAAIARLIAK